ncbi:hypothetical protein [Paenibacillus ferrarius]|uniref:hypothetical protein n=1 Tax=Paenibacillus ferrarius TaxID=1469647 RepID=UPI0009A4E8B4|nr:hypothetical protein [Paenibacillus ferrarius]
MDVTNWSQLEDYLNKKIASALKNEGAETARDEMQTHIQEDVYDVYTPISYERRMYDDGLIDPRNIEILMHNDNTISLENIAYDGEKNVPLIVETGNGYFRGASDVLTRGRKFTEATKQSLRKSNKLESALAKGLKRQGLDISSI